jgi:hypothetical protein
MRNKSWVDAGKRKFRDRVGRTYEEDEEVKKCKILQEAKKKKSFRYWVMQPDAWEGPQGVRRRRQF